MNFKWNFESSVWGEFVFKKMKRYGETFDFKESPGWIHGSVDKSRIRLRIQNSISSGFLCEFPCRIKNKWFFDCISKTRINNYIKIYNSLYLESLTNFYYLNLALSRFIEQNPTCSIFVNIRNYLYTSLSTSNIVPFLLLNVMDFRKHFQNFIFQYKIQNI